MLVNSTFSNFVKELPMPIAQKATAIAITMETDTMIIVAIMVLIPFLLFLMFLFMNLAAFREYAFEAILTWFLYYKKPSPNRLVLKSLRKFQEGERINQSMVQRVGFEPTNP